ncbi:plasma protease C1 inhibitor [Hypomesus transpacificus]|uniref:plasma protease C1 inhibitor n=1 Tax=Hypomesus transpacificus TaxID=137520 RepID=UPI001F0880C7|nr:plasma protease C1 inhibitor [Hypomesus transpacificus]
MRYSALILCFPLLLVLKASASSLRVVPGSTLTLPCLPFQSSSNEATITWKFNGIQVQDPLVVIGSRLKIDPVRASSQGEYECVLFRNNTEQTRKYTISVDAFSSYALKHKEGSIIVLPCERPQGAQPENYVLWFKETSEGQRRKLSPAESADQEQLKLSGRLEWLYADPQDEDQSIQVHQVTIEDSGTYHCESEEGEKFSSIELVVEAAPIVEPYSCSGFTTPWEPCLDEDNRSWAAILEESLTEFSMKIYSHLRHSQPSENMLFSPISISAVLSHLLLGARKETRELLEAALSLPHNFTCVHSQMKKLKQRLQDNMKMASQIYYHTNIPLSESFANQSLQYYDAEAVKLTNSSKENVETINHWVAEQTNNKINHLVDSVPEDSQLVLLNAVYFNGRWKVKFDSEKSRAPFEKLDNEIVMVPVLYSSKYPLAMEYVSVVKSQVAVFPLSGQTSLFILLPPSGTLSDLQLVEGKMTVMALRKMVEQMKSSSPQPTEVTLPKLNLDVLTQINPLLGKLGLSTLFEGAHLCGIYPDQPLVLTDARHRAFLALTEAGVEAGAATSLSFSRSFSTFSALRPFLLVLWSERANQPLFLGRVTQP